MTDEKGFEAKDAQEQDGVPGVDELAFRLQVESEEPPFEGVVLFGKTGKAYSFTKLMAHHIQFISEALQLTVNILEKIKEEGAAFEHNKKPRQSEKTNNTDGNTKSDKS